MPDDVHFNCVVTIGKQPGETPTTARSSRALTQRRLPLDSSSTGSTGKSRGLYNGT